TDIAAYDTSIKGKKQKVAKYKKTLDRKSIRVKGEYSPDRKETFNLNIDVDNPSELLDKIKTLKEELSELEDEMNTTPKDKDASASPVEASKTKSNSIVPPKPLQALTEARVPLKNTTPTHKQV
ncbi:hypothetical protein LCGC14_1643120, partial [marine sediment metagenome]